MLFAERSLSEAIQQLVAFNADQNDLLARLKQSRRATQYLLAFDAATVVFAILLTFVVIRAAQAQWKLVAERELAARLLSQVQARFSERLERLTSGLLAILRRPLPIRRNWSPCWKIIVDRSRDLTGADLAALGVGNDPERPFDPLVFSGMTSAQANVFGRIPAPVGYARQIPQAKESFCTADVTKLPEFRGFPRRPFPPMSPIPPNNDRLYSDRR